MTQQAKGGNELKTPLDEATRDLLIAIGRVGKNKRDCMKWVLEVIQKDPDGMTTADWHNFSYEIFALCWQVKENPPIPTPFGFASDEVPEISLKEAKKILGVFRTTIESVLARENLDLGYFKKRLNIIWMDDQEQYWIDNGIYDNPRNAALDALSDLIAEDGHRIKKCGAPRPWGGGEQCKKIFLPKRPNQVYCSSDCQNRETTRATRERQMAAKSKGKRKVSRKKK